MQRALWPVYTQSVFTLVMCHLGDTPPPQRTMGTDCIYQIQECSSKQGAHTPTSTCSRASRTIPSFCAVLIQLFSFLGGGGFSGSRRLPGYFVQTSMLDGLLAVPACRWAAAWVATRPASSLNAPFLFLTRPSSPRPPTVRGYCNSGLFGISPCSVSLHR